MKHSELQVDTITMFRINDEGQLEGEDKSNGYPSSYKVVSSKLMDTSEVTFSYMETTPDNVTADE